MNLGRNLEVQSKPWLQNRFILASWKHKNKKVNVNINSNFESPIGKNQSFGIYLRREQDH